MHGPDSVPSLARLSPGPWSGWNPIGAVAGALLAGIAFVVIFPILRMVGILVAEATGAKLGIDASIASVVWNTFVVVGCSSLIALFFGVALALINERTDGGFKGLGNFMPVAPLMLPSITGVLGWVVLFDPRVGLVNVFIRSVTGGETFGEGPFNIYSLPGLLFAMSIHLVPTIYLIVSAALRNLDPSVEEASRVFGSGPLGTGLRITLPAIRPAIFEAWLLSVINGIAMFSVPVILGTGAKIEVMSVRIWSYLTAFPSNQQAAMVLATGMLLVILALRLAQWKLVPAGRHGVIGGRGVRSAPTRLGPVRYVTRAFIAAYILFSLVLPVLALLLVSLEPFWTAQVPWGQLSFGNYEQVLVQNPATSRALINSLLLASAGATIGTAVAGYLMLYAHQAKPAGRGGKKKGGQKTASLAGFKVVVDFVTALPATIPHSLVGVSFILAFTPIYGTIWILLLAYVMMELPRATSAAKAATSIIGPELAEASRIFRASPGRTMSHILAPLALPGLAAGWVLVFVHILGEVTAAAILSGSSNPVVGSVLLDLWQQGNFPMMTAFALIIWAIASVLVLIMLRLNNRSLGKTR